jgi:TatD DNase family protein
VYDLEKNYPEHVFLMMGLHPTHVKENYLEELQHVEEEERKRKFYVEKLELIYIGIKLFIRTTDRFQETNSISKAIQATY